MGSIENSFILTDSNENTTQQFDENSFSVCCCCLELAWKQCLWKPYMWMDQEEIYGEMLQECFGILLPVDENKTDLICKVCITQLRSALNFKRQVLTCRQLLLNNVKELQELPNLKIRTVMPEYETEDIDNNNEKHYDDPLSSLSDAFGCGTDEQPLNTEHDVSKKCEPQKNSKVIKKKCNSNNNQQESVRKLTYEITGNRKGKRHINYLKPRLNLCVLLENSTLVPFKANKGCFFCFYCTKQFAVFEELKQHTRTIHANVTFKEILKRFYKPERVRADASDIICKICNQEVDSVNSLVDHLVKRHNIQFSDHVRKPVECIIPYDLSDGRNRCSICRKEFIFFKMLSKHMNEHTTNYVCPVCGKCFLLPERLQTHKYLHKSGPAVKCEHCGKKLNNDFLLRTHIRNVHNKILYGCSVCDLKFRTFRERLAHLDKSHGMKLTNVKCSQCNKTFGSPQTLYAHVKHTHTMGRGQGKYECDACSRVFVRKTELTRHMLVHTKERNFECHLCLKRYSRRSTLNGHLRIHRDDRRWACRDCGAAFVQKCSLHSHIRTHHKGADVHQLEVCRNR